MPMRLLLVDDSPADVTLVKEAVKEFLQQGMLSLDTVTDGNAAFAFLRRQAPYVQVASPDLVLLDLNLPGKSGYDILTELRQDTELRFVPVVVFTTTSEEQVISRCYGLGANAYIVKPLELEQFLSLVKITVAFWSACKFRTLK